MRKYYFIHLLNAISNPTQAPQLSMAEQHTTSHTMRPSNEDGPYKGPIHETSIDFVDGQIDLGDFASPDMVETLKISDAILPFENLRRNSLATILEGKKSEKPQMPSRDEALLYVDNYQKVIAPYVPIVHGPTFRKQVCLEKSPQL